MFYFSFKTNLNTILIKLTYIIKFVIKKNRKCKINIVFFLKKLKKNNKNVKKYKKIYKNI